MHQQHAKNLLGGQLRKDAVERLELGVAELARRHQRQRRHGGGNADQGHGSAPAQEREGGAAIGLVAPQVIVPGFRRAMPFGADIGVVIAGDHGDMLAGAHALQPGPRRREFGFERKIDEIACHRDVVRPLRPDIGDQRIQHLAAVVFVAVACPVEVTERTLAGEIAKPRRRQGRQMRIRQMRQRECRHQNLPPSIGKRAALRKDQIKREFC